MCTKEEFKKLLIENNEKRDKNLDRKLHSLKMEIFEKVDKSVNSRIEHLKTSPETTEKLHVFQENCIKNTTNFSSLMKEIKEDVKEIKTGISDIKKNYLTRTEFDPYRKRIDRISDILLGFLIGCAIVVAFYILIKTGLPTP